VAFLALLAAVVVAALWAREPKRSRLRNALEIGGILLLALLLGAGGTALWYFHRPQPPPTRETLFEGVSYQRDVRTSPRPMVVHVARIDLRAPGISFFVTPTGERDGILRGATTSEFLTRYGAQLAINGDFLLPWWSNGPHDYYPHEGWPVDVLGLGISGGREYGWRQTPFSTLVFEESGAVSIVEVKDRNTPIPRARHAVSGKTMLVVDGAPAAAADAPGQGQDLHPRVAAALDRTASTLLLFVVDGRQPGYSEGARLGELARIIVEHGGHRAMNLDGGGSSTMVAAAGESEYRLLSTPIHTRIPWRERPVANHLGVLARPIGGRAP
jgi:hypothetical protein